MARNNQPIPIEIHENTLEKIGEEIMILVTGQNLMSGGEIDYPKLVRRVLVILVAVYGLGRIKLLREVAFSIVSTLVTRWLAQKAIENIAPGLLPKSR